jgi:hypothetical protein
MREIVENYQFWVLVGLIAGGFAWMLTWLRSIDGRLNQLETRVTVVEARMGFIERLLEMVGASSNIRKEKTDP